MASPPPPPRAPLLRWWVAALAVLFVAAVRLRPAPAPGAAAEAAALRARAQLGELVKAVRGFGDATGRLPSTLTDLTPAGPEDVFFLERVPPDPWGAAYRYVVTADGRSFTLSSAGADGQPGTPDDVTPEAPGR